MKEMWSSLKTLPLIQEPQKPELRRLRGSGADGQQIYFLVPEVSGALRRFRPTASKSSKKQRKVQEEDGVCSPGPHAGRGEMKEANPERLRQQTAVFPPLFFKARKSLSLSALPLQRGRLSM